MNEPRSMTFKLLPMKHVGRYGLSVSECGECVMNPWRNKRYAIGTTRAGYKQVQKSIQGKRVTIMVHRLVAMAFIGIPQWYDELEVNHKDGNKANNHYSNLEWITKKENMQHALDTGLWKRENGGRKTIKTERDEYIQSVVGITRTKEEIMRLYGLSRANLNRILRKKRCVNEVLKDESEKD